MQAAANTLGRKLVIVKAGTKDDLDKAFAAINGQLGGALVVQTDPFFLGQRDQIVALAAQHAMPAIYYLRDYPAAGGLVSYERNFPMLYGWSADMPVAFSRVKSRVIYRFNNR